MRALLQLQGPQALALTNSEGKTPLDIATERVGRKPADTVDLSQTDLIIYMLKFGWFPGGVPL